MRACVAALAPLSDKAGLAATAVSRGDIPYQGPSNIDAGKNGVFIEVLGDMKLCGLLDFMLDAISCLLGGMTLADALPVIIKGALDAMGIENFGELFIGLPPEQQAKMDAIVQKKSWRSPDETQQDNLLEHNQIQILKIQTEGFLIILCKRTYLPAPAKEILREHNWQVEQHDLLAKD